MGTMAEKLAYLKESKEQIKNALETPSNVMRDYANWIKKYVDNQPTSKVSDGVCTNALDVPLVSLGVDGQSEQKSYSGKNLLPVDEIFIFTQAKRIDVSIPAGTYKVSFLSETHNGSSAPTIKFEKNGNWFGLDFSGEEKTVTLAQDENSIIFYSNGYDFVASEGITTTINQLMISKEGGDYEPYVGGQPSPNPDYKQDIEVIDGVNLFDVDTLQQGEISETTGEDSNSSSYSVKTPFIHINTDNVIFSWKCAGKVNEKQYGNRIYEYNENKEFIKVTLYYNKGTQKLNLVLDNNTKYIRATMYCDYAFTPTTINENFAEIQITEGTTPKPYLPHGCIGLEQSGINLLPNNATTQTVNGITFTINEDKSISIKGTNSTNWTSLIITDSFVLEAGTYYLKTFNRMPNSCYTTLRNILTQKAIVSTNSATNIQEFTLTETTKVDVYIGFGNEVSYNNIIYPMITKSQNDIYEPYHSPKLYPINLNGNSIAKVGDVKDLLKIYRNGDVEIEKKIGKYVTTGNENLSAYQIATNGTFAVRCNLPTLLSINNKKGLCNKMIIKTLIELSNGDIGIGVHNDNYVYCNATGQASTLEDAQQFWQNNAGMEVHYNLAAPEIIKLPSISPIELWEETNKFELITNLDTTFEMEYVVKV